LSKRVLAAFLVTLFIVATFATVAEVQAHYTLGKQGNNGPEYRMGSTTDTMPDDHVPGHLAYVSPGWFYQTPGQQLNYYSPQGAIITDTSGGLFFLINVSDTRQGEAGDINITREANLWRGNWLYIAIPPEFGVPEGWETNEGNVVVTSLSNDYSTIKTGKFGATHSRAPGWWYVAFSAWTKPADDARGWLYSAGNDPYRDRQSDGCYWVWIGGLTAPSCAGKYFFKLFYTDPAWLYNPWESYIDFPAENYPTLVVKGELDPGYISGRIRYGGSFYYGYYYGEPIWKPGRVRAEGEAIDPITNEPTGRKVCGVGYFNASANGFYEIEGLAPGIYTLTAEAKGFPPVTLATQITVKRGQSIHGIDIYVYPGAKINLKVNSKCPTGAVEFPDWVSMGTSDVGDKLAWSDYPIADYYVEVKDSEGNLVAAQYGTWNLTETVEYNGRLYFPVFFGDETSYEGADIVWDGHIPDEMADYVSGMEAGVYYAYIYVFGYVQLDEYEVVVPSSQYTGVIYREVDIFQGGKVHATVHFHNQEMPSADQPPVIGGDLILEAYDQDGTLRAWNYTTVPANDPNYKSVSLDLIGDAWIPYGMHSGTYTFKVWYPGYAQQEFPQHTVQLCTWGTFSFHLVKGGNITVSVFSRDWQSPAQRLDWLHEPAALRVYFYNSAGESVGYAQDIQDDETDEIQFKFDGVHYSIDDYIFYFWEPFGPLRPSGLPTDVYSIRAYTVGYIQKMVPEVWVQKASSTGDIPLYLYAGAAIYVTVNFKTEELFHPLSQDVSSFYFRTNVFDEEGNLAAANITSVPTYVDWTPDGSVTQWTFQVLGFSSFTTPGDLTTWPATGGVFSRVTGSTPSDAWGYVERFSMVGHYNYGIDAGTYTIEVNDETNGYVQTATVAVTVTLMGSATVFLDMHQQAHITGTVYQRNWMGDFRLASWYTVELSGSPAATTDTEDGWYAFWAPAGTYTLKVYLAAPDETEAVVVQERTVVVTWGASAGGQDFYLEEGGVPIPEFPAAGVLMLISALAASLYLLRWRKQAIVPMP